MNPMQSPNTEVGKLLCSPELHNEPRKIKFKKWSKKEKRFIGTTKFRFEYTDTFGGEANYSWVKRHEEDFPENISDLSLMCRAKKWAGLSNVRGRTENFGDCIAFYPRGYNTVLFVNAEV
jgi:hypothetical protein